MGRKKKIDEQTNKTLRLPKQLIADIDAILYDDLVGRIPYGAWQDLVTSLLNAFLHGKSYSIIIGILDKINDNLLHQYEEQKAAPIVQDKIIIRLEAQIELIDSIKAILTNRS